MSTDLLLCSMPLFERYTKCEIAAQQGLVMSITSVNADFQRINKYYSVKRLLQFHKIHKMHEIVP